MCKETEYLPSSQISKKDDNKAGVSTTSNTEDKVLNNGTRVIRTTQTLKNEHDHGATTVKKTNTKRIHVIETEERIIGEDLTLTDIFYFFCPCFKKKKEEDGEADGGRNGNEDKSKWNL